jgi:hypothetical protein
MSIAVSDNAALAIAAAIREQTAVHQQISGSLVTLAAQATTLNAFLVTNWSAAASKTPLTPAASLNVIASAFNDSAQLSGYLIKNQSEAATFIDKISTGLAQISAHIGQGVTTQQIAVSDQIKNNKFQQQTTNDALTRAELPKTEVPPSSVQESISNAINDVGELKLQVGAANLVTDFITDNVTYVQTQLVSWVAQSTVGQAASTAWGSVKTFLKGINALQESAVTTTGTNAITRGTLTGDFPPPPNNVA